MDAAGTTWVGIDVSKDRLDACQLGPGNRPRARAFANTPAGFRRLVAWADPAARFCLESTGAYGRGLADHLAAACPDLRADRDLLVSVPGVGRQTAATVQAELPERAAGRSAQAAAAYAGLAPREFRSGSSVRKRTRLSKAGNARLRTALYLPTLTAIRFNPLLKGFFERLVAAGKPKMQAVGACMRKLVMLCYGVLKNRAPFDPAWAAKKAS